MLAFTLCTLLNAQDKDCTLGLGGKDTETIIQVFQLNEVQQEKLTTWAGELKEYNRVMGDSIRILFDTHPQKTMEQLQALANKYGVLRDKITYTSSLYDQKLLATFNQRQYDRYVALCKEAIRKPMPPYQEENTRKSPE